MMVNILKVWSKSWQGGEEDLLVAMASLTDAGSAAETLAEGGSGKDG
jgi:hypothetical protein